VSIEVDHLVVACDTLAQGAAWCERTLGVSPGPGGRHALMGTHNRLLSIAGEAFPRAYLELIAIDPLAAPPGRPRWFGIDDAALREAVREAPRLHHVVCRCSDVERQRQGLLALGLDPGRALAAQRETTEGTLSWRILVRDDGAIACDGALPTLIEWQDRHPSAAMPPSAVNLLAVTLAGLPEDAVRLLQPQGMICVAPAQPDMPRLLVRLATPLGPVTLSTRR
jgi:hypothetical protein